MSNSSMPLLARLSFSKPMSRKRTGYFFLATALALISNLLVINLPFSIPFLIGNVVIITLFLRLGLWWALAGLLIIMLPVHQVFYWYIALWQLLVVMLWPQEDTPFNARLILPALLGKALLLLWLAPQSLIQSTLDYLIALVLLMANFLLIVRAAQFLLTLSAAKDKQRQQLLRQQLSQRIALYSAVPSSLFISLILNSAITLHFGNFIESYQASLDERQVLLEKN